MADIITDKPKIPKKTRAKAPTSDDLPKDSNNLPAITDKPITEDYRHFDDGVIPKNIEITRIDHRRFWSLFLTPGTKAYGNGSESARQTWPYLTDRSANVAGSRMMRKANSMTIIRAAIRDSGANVIRRMQQLAKIATGEAERVLITKDGKRIEQPTFTEQIKAIEVLNKIDGIHSMIGVERENMTAEMKALRSEMMTELRGKRAKHNTDREYADQALIVGSADESIDDDIHTLDTSVREN